MSKQLLIAISFMLIACPIFGQNVIEPCKQGTSLITYLHSNYSPSPTLSYDRARDTMYAVIDNDGNNNISCIYTQFSVTWNPTQDPSSNVYQNGAGINAEHVYPQSKGAGLNITKRDLHNLRPAQVDVNSARQSSIFAEIDDNDTDRWYRLGQILYSTPTSNINEYSEREIQNGTAWEPREDVKGDIARIVFYFYTMHQSEADAADPNYFHDMKSTLLQWHYADPIDAGEVARSAKVAVYQGNENPFVLDSSLVRRAYFLPDASYPDGDPNCYTISPPPVVSNTDSVLIIEIADPSDIYQARFVNIQNRSSSPVDISNWSLRKYSNGSPTYTYEETFNNVLAPGEIYSVAYNFTTFYNTYGQNPETSNGNVITGNGDDVYALADANGNNIDVFGIIGVDGSGENWEYTDDFVKRKSTVYEPTTTLNISEWEFYNSSTTADILTLSSLFFTAPTLPTGTTCLINWTNLQHSILQQGGRRLRKNQLNPSGWTGAAISQNALHRLDDGWTEMEVLRTDKTFVYGLGWYNNSMDKDSIRFGIELFANGIAYVRENGYRKHTIGAYAIGDIFTVAKISNEIHYFHNGIWVYTSTKNPWGFYHVDASIRSMNGIVYQARSSFSCNPSGTNVNKIFNTNQPQLAFDEVVAYPNPFEDNIIVNYAAQVDILETLDLYDVNGRHIRSISISEDGQTTIDTNDLKSGLYIIAINNIKFLKVVKL